MATQSTARGMAGAQPARTATRARQPRKQPEQAITVIELPTVTLSEPVMVLWVEGKPVSVNAMYSRARTGKVYLTVPARTWETAVWAETRKYRVTRCTTLDSRNWRLPLRVRCTFVACRGDGDNYLKATLDGLKLGLDIDDKHFDHVEAVKRLSDHKGIQQGCLIEVWEADAVDGQASA